MVFEVHITTHVVFCIPITELQNKQQVLWLDVNIVKRDVDYLMQHVLRSASPKIIDCVPIKQTVLFKVDFKELGEAVKRLFHATIFMH